ncbi:Translation initiation factor eIF-2B subunit delta-like [Homarus americanus]|uniref:Translation initiation factor eIF2B subunit delta n=1 Tax=Homarus americanus TaxID=6706 RepID=A0A8J5N2S8_HOMAM|nr:Translation initiation factor eIF-2B subunit delta-like [Homarus americanus]
MAPPEGSKRRKPRKRSKKRTSQSGACASPSPGRIPGEPLQGGGPVSVPSEVEVPKPVPLVAGHQQPNTPEKGSPQSLSPKKRTPQRSALSARLVKTGQPQPGVCATGPQQPETPKGGTSNVVLTKKSPLNGPVSKLGSAKADSPKPKSPNTKFSSPPKLGLPPEASENVITLEADAPLELPPQQQQTKVGSSKNQQSHRKPNSPQPTPAQDCILPPITTSQLLTLETLSSFIPVVGVEKANSLSDVKEQSTSLTKGTSDANFITLKSEGDKGIIMSETNKLDNLCNLLENIVIQHSGKEAMSNNTIKLPVAQTSQTITGPPPVKVPPSTTDSPPTTTSQHKGEKTKEEIECERKGRKEAKKAKKKGGEKAKSENDKENYKNINVENKKKESQEEKVMSMATNTQQIQPGDQQGQLQQHTKLSVALEGTDQSDAAGKSKADLKRERREKQEAQRQAKLAAKAKQEAEKQQKGQEEAHPSNNKIRLPQKKKKLEGEGLRRLKDRKSFSKGPSDRRIPLLGHLTPYSSQPPLLPVNCDTIHPAVRTLGLKMKDRIVDGSTARVVSTLAALKQFIHDYRTPESCDLSRDLAEKLLPNVAFLNGCRPQAIAMDNAIRFLKHKINSIEPNMPEAQAKDELRTAIDEYVQDNINLGSSTIASHAAMLIQDGDVILTFGSALVIEVVEAACNVGRRVSVVVADTPYPPSGAAMVKILSALGVTTYYRLITDVTHIMHKVTKVVVEAEAVMMNGAVQGMCGTASLALAAVTHDTPFIVLYADRVVFCPSRDYCGLLVDWRQMQKLNVVSLVYDVTPACLVTALVTEQSVLPTSAVPVIIRRNYADILGQD